MRNERERKKKSLLIAYARTCTNLSAMVVRRADFPFQSITSETSNTLWNDWREYHSHPFYLYLSFSRFFVCLLLLLLLFTLSDSVIRINLTQDEKPLLYGPSKYQETLCAYVLVDIYVYVEWINEIAREIGLVLLTKRTFCVKMFFFCMCEWVRRFEKSLHTYYFSAHPTHSLE